MPKHKPTTIDFPLKAILRDRKTAAGVVARIHPMMESDVEAWSEWEYEKNDEDRTWEWDEVFEEAEQSDSGIECYALYADERLHGLVSFDLQGHSSSGGCALIVDYVATNPCNRRGDAGLKDVGTALLAFAVCRSRELGWKGRLWLESLERAEPVYMHLGFAKLPGRSKDGHALFELGEVGAARLRQTVREQGILSLPDSK